MEIRLTDAELFVLAHTLERELPAGLSADSDGSDQAFWAEGMKSLIARYLVRRIAAEEYIVDAELSAFLGKLLSCEQFLSIAAQGADGAILSTFVMGHGEVFSLAPIAEGIWQLGSAHVSEVAQLAIKLVEEIGPVSLDVVANEEHRSSHSVTNSGELLLIDDEPPARPTEAISRLTELVAAS